jgi:hypothetical protein
MRFPYPIHLRKTNIMTTASSVQVEASFYCTQSSPALRTSASESSDLAEAVAALNVRQPSPASASVALPSAKDAASNVGSYGSDSGYATQSSTPVKDPFVNQHSAHDSFSRLFLRQGLYPRKPVKLLPFDKPIPQLTQNRFQNLRELHSDNLIKLTRGLPRCQGIIMNLKVLGETESSAEPWVFIQCDKVVAGKVSNFFKQSFVKSDFKPEKPDAYTPYFQICVCPFPPKLYAGTERSAIGISGDPGELHWVYCENSLEHTATSCGMGIQICGASTPGMVRNATLGGLVKVLNEKGKFDVFGITAAHILDQLQSDEDEENVDHQGECDDDLDGNFSDDGDLYELDSSPFSSQISKDVKQSTGTGHSNEWGFQSRIGYVHKTSNDNSPDERNLDWALIAIRDQFLYKPNIIHDYQDITKIVKSGTTRGERPVVFSTSSTYEGFGTLAGSWSYLMLAPGKSLIRTYLLTLTEGIGQYKSH